MQPRKQELVCSTLPPLRARFAPLFLLKRPPIKLLELANRDESFCTVLGAPRDGVFCVWPARRAGGGTLHVCKCATPPPSGGRARAIWAKKSKMKNEGGRLTNKCEGFEIWQHPQLCHLQQRRHGILAAVNMGQLPLLGSEPIQ